MAALSLLPNLDLIENALIDPAVSGILTDADGTLGEIRDRPEAARVDAEVAAILERLSHVYRLTAVISGRRAREVADMVGAAGLLYIGNHGLERLHDGRFDEVGGGEEIAAAKAEIKARLPHAEGLVLEDKRSVLAIHYRRCRDEAAVEEAKRLVHEVGDAHGLRVQGGRRVLEVRPLKADKGETVTRLAEEYGLKQVIYLGDDATDVDAFRALKAAGRSTGLNSITVGVVAAESPAAIAEEADYAAGSVSEVRQFLTWLAERGVRDSL